MSYKVCSSSCPVIFGRYFLNNGIISGVLSTTGHNIHASSTFKYPQAAALKLPTNVVDINSAEVGRFSPLRERDLSGPVINSVYAQQSDVILKIDITAQEDNHANKYDCRGALNLSSSMQSNVPSPFSGNHTHLGMPGSQWGQGYKYLSDHLQSAHYLNLRNEYRKMSTGNTSGIRAMSTDANVPMSASDKLKKAVKEYGSTVIIFHVSISLMSLGGCYLLVSSGVDLVALLEKFNLAEGAINKVATSGAGTFVVAYAIHKIFAPLRMGITLTATPFIVRYLRRVGFLKQPVNGG